MFGKSVVSEPELIREIVNPMIDGVAVNLGEDQTIMRTE